MRLLLTILGIISPRAWAKKLLESSQSVVSEQERRSPEAPLKTRQESQHSAVTVPQKRGSGNDNVARPRRLPLVNLTSQRYVLFYFFREFLTNI